MAILRIAVPVLKKVRSISRTGRCDMLRVMWLPTVELFDDVPNISTYFLYRECSSSFAVAMLGKNAIIDDCIFEHLLGVGGAGRVFERIPQSGAPHLLRCSTPFSRGLCPWA